MCGIFGIAVFKNSTVRANNIRLILKTLAIKNEIRGTNATGYAFSSKKSTNIFKYPIKSSEFVKLTNYRKTFRDMITGDHGNPYSVIGHTRQQTKGTYLNNDNNHPISAGSIVGVHNGFISNDDFLFDWLKNQPHWYRKRIGEVDSEAIFAVIDYLSKSHKCPNLHGRPDLIGNHDDPVTRAIITSGKKLIGSYVYALIDSHNPKMLWIVRDQGPVSINYYKNEKVLIFSSISRHIEDSIALCGFSEPEELSLDPGSVISINVETSTYNINKLEKTRHYGEV